MLFVDGAAVTCYGQAFARGHGLLLQRGRYYMPDVFLWIPVTSATVSHPLTSAIAVAPLWTSLQLPLQTHAVGANYYATVRDTDGALLATREALWTLGFAPEIFPRPRRWSKAQRIEQALATDLRENAVHDRYDVALLVAADDGYIPAVEAIRQLGKQVYVGFFGAPSPELSSALRHAADGFVPIDLVFLSVWTQYQAERGMSAPR